MHVGLLFRSEIPITKTRLLGTDTPRIRYNLKHVYRDYRSIFRKWIKVENWAAKKNIGRELFVCLAVVFPPKWSTYIFFGFYTFSFSNLKKDRLHITKDKDKIKEDLFKKKNNAKKESWEINNCQTQFKNK